MNADISNEQWNLPSKVFHWLTALMVLIQVPLGIYAKDLRLSPLKLDLFVWHKSIGFTILLLTIARLAWRLSGPVPPAVPDKKIRQRLARISHVVLYVLMLLLPASGWVISSAANIPISFFWLLEVPAIIGPNEALQEVAEKVHGTCVVLLLAVLTLHIGAALCHHFVRRDIVLKRMWF